jgi:hypothetical protein
MLDLFNKNDSKVINCLVQNYVQRVDGGECIDRSAFIADHPELGARLSAALPTESDLGICATASQHRAMIENGAGGNVFETFSGSSPLIGQEIDGCIILGELGRGAMGCVYRAASKDGREVAVKTLHVGPEMSAAQLDRFSREGLTQAKLKHPNIVPVYGSGRSDGTPYLVMELVGDGATLQSALEDAHEPFNQRRAATITRDLALALAFSHKHGVIHRDIKPSNILMSGNTPKLTDFGLAFMDSSDTRLSRSGEMIGTISYMSPEQARGIGEPQPQWDVYSLGATLYELLTGRPPFVGKSHSDILTKLIDEDPPPVTRPSGKVRAALEAICIKCLEKAPDLRYASAQELAADLDRFLESRAVSAPAINWPLRQARKFVSRRRMPIAIAIAAVVLAGNCLYLGQRIGNQRKLALLEATGGRIDTDQFSTGFLLWALRSEDLDGRLAAIAALAARADDDRIDDVLMAQCDAEDPRVRLKLALSLAEHPRPLAIHACERLIDDDEDTVAGGAIKLAEILDDKQLLTQLRQLASRHNRMLVRYAMTTALHISRPYPEETVKRFLPTIPEAGRAEILAIVRTGVIRPDLPVVIDVMKRAASDRERDQAQRVLVMFADADCETAAEWSHWWKRHGHDWQPRACRTVTGCEATTGLALGDIIWRLDNEPLPDVMEWPPPAGATLEIVRDNTLRKLSMGPGRSQAQPSFIGTISGRPVGDSPIAQQLQTVAAVRVVQRGIADNL